MRNSAETNFHERFPIPLTDDPETTRLASLLSMVIWPLVGVTVIVILALFLYKAPALVVIAAIVILLLELGVYVWMRRFWQASRQREQRLIDYNRELEEARETLERRMSEQIKVLEQHTRMLSTSAEISAALTAASNPATLKGLDGLLSETVDLIQTKFSAYFVAPVQASIYLYDEDDATLVLHATSDSTNQHLQGIRLKAGQSSALAAAFISRQPFISRSEITSSELAVPLGSDGDLLGVLDLHCAAPESFNPDHTAIFQALCDQIAIAIGNARLLEENRKQNPALEASQHAGFQNGGMGASGLEGWLKLLRSDQQIGFYCLASGDPKPVEGEWQADMLQARESGQKAQSDDLSVAIPIKIRGQVMGVARLQKPPASGAWTSNEIDLVETISDRLSAALESASLYEETRRRAERERLTSEITAKLRASNDPQTILQTAVSELRKALRAGQAQLLLQSFPAPRAGETPQAKPPIEQQEPRSPQ